MKKLLMVGGLAALAGGVLYYTRDPSHKIPIDHNEKNVQERPRHLVEQDAKRGDAGAVAKDFAQGAKNVTNQVKESARNVASGDSSIKEEGQQIKKTMKS